MTGLVQEFTLAPGASANYPNPALTTWSYVVPPPCVVPTLVPTPPPEPNGWGAVVTDSLTDSVFACDGFNLAEQSEYNPLTGRELGVIINAFPIQLVGIGTNLAISPSVIGTVPAFWGIDGQMIERIDDRGSSAVPCFCAPVPCTPAVRLLNGVAFVSRSIGCGPPPGAMQHRTLGQSSTPGPTEGVVVSGVRGPAVPWLTFGGSVTAPGWLCMPATE